MPLLSIVSLELDKRLSERYYFPLLTPSLSDGLWAPCESSLKQLHFALFSASDFSFAAGAYRTVGSNSGSIYFPYPHHLDKLMHESFNIKRENMSSVLAWTIEVMDHIHPFLDGNRRTCWKFTNLWLQHLGYKELDWDALRPIWENGIQKYCFGATRDQRRATLVQRLDHLLRALLEKDYGLRTS